MQGVVKKSKSVRPLGRRTRSANMKHKPCPCTEKRTGGSRGRKK